eukprot:9468659-Pyramimonas_sp.AAC.2
MNNTVSTTASFQPTRCLKVLCCVTPTMQGAKKFRVECLSPTYSDRLQEFRPHGSVHGKYSSKLSQLRRNFKAKPGTRHHPVKHRSTLPKCFVQQA